MPVRVRDVMTRRLVTVQADDPVDLAAQRMLRAGFSALPVVRGVDRLVGIVSLVDVLRHREDGAPAGETVGSIMTTDVLTMSPATSAAVVAHRLRTYGELRVMPIVERGLLVGVVTRSDLLRGPREQPGLLSRLFGRTTLPDPVPARMPRERRPDARTVGEVMTSTDLVVVRPATPCSRAVELLLTRRFSLLPVVEDDGGLVGVVSEADLLRDPLDGSRSGPPRTVGAAMTRSPTVVRPDTPLAEARHLVVDRGFRVLPVTRGRTLVGVLSRSDLV
ncbi:CBS domain-containing protein [Pseudonocardia sp. NPDC049154]|uniref:CBS domain-containing protein n=1 Tax=Pseudonocardia sp. NPDC049154 TaxID=3155501 RepID=UPI0033E0128A